MSTVEVGTPLDAVHMRVVYFADAADLHPMQVTPITARSGVATHELTRVFRQLELLLEYAALVTASVPSTPRPEHGVTPVSLLAPAESAEDVTSQFMNELVGNPELDPLVEQDRDAEQGKEAGALTDPQGGAPRRLPRPVGHAGAPTPATLASALPQIIALRMGSPLQVILEIPLVTWPSFALGLLGLAKRIAAAPLRISSKRRPELLKSAIIDKQTALAMEGRVDVLAQLLLAEGPLRGTRGPDEVVFSDPDDPGGGLEPVLGAPGGSGSSRAP